MNMGNLKRSLYSLCLFICAACAFVILTGCASSEDTGKMQWDINELRSEIKELKKTSKSTTRMEQLNSKLKEIEETQGLSGRTVSDLLIQVQSLASEFQVLTGRFEESRYFSEKSSSELLESKDMLIEKMKALELAVSNLEKKIKRAQAAPPPVKKVTPPKKKAAPAKVKKETPKKAKKPDTATNVKSAVKNTYMSAYQAFKEGEITKSRKAFTAIINDFPENDYSDNARFWIGETYYKEGKFEDAILAYQELFDRNPKSDKVPGAMLKQGLAFYALKDKKTGKIILEKLIEKYPGSEPARLAIRKINKPVVPPKK